MSFPMAGCERTIGRRLRRRRTRPAGRTVPAFVATACLALATVGCGQFPGVHEWAALFLGRIQAPVGGNNLVSVVAWEDQEHTEAAWNPLATPYSLPGSTRFNSVGVQNFRS